MWLLSYGVSHKNGYFLLDYTFTKLRCDTGGGVKEYGSDDLFPNITYSGNSVNGNLTFKCMIVDSGDGATGLQVPFLSLLAIFIISRLF